MKTHNTKSLPVLKFAFYPHAQRVDTFFLEHKEISQEIENQTDPERKMIFLK